MAAAIDLIRCTDVTQVIDVDIGLLLSNRHLLLLSICLYLDPMPEYKDDGAWDFSDRRN